MAEPVISTQAPRPLSGRNLTAVLGPTNTGKTHLAIERMLGHESGLIGLPLRLLAREVYDKIAARVGAGAVALITGEEKIKPDNPRYYVCTVEAMPRDVDVDFLAIDEIQLAADPERGHVFTERMFTARGQSETLLLGASTMQETIRDLMPGANFISRPRLSKLTYSGQKKITRLPRRSAIVAFSAGDVYQIAELIRRQRGGAAVVLGALSPRTRNAQVALYQSGDVDFLVATDAIGMGLNLDVDHVAFAGARKFDGRTHRQLTAGELGQIAGRAGRYMNDGTFGVTGDVEPFPQEMIDKLENHNFESVKILQWRNGQLDYGSLDALIDSLRAQPSSPRLTRARQADDVVALETLARDDEVRSHARSPAALRRLWEACQIPDYRKISAANHAELVSTVYKFIMSEAGVIPEEWFAGQVAFADRTDGDIDTLSTRIAHIRTWNFVSHRREWLANPDHWQARAREIEDALSDALHERLTQRFVDKRTSVLMKSLRDSDALAADIETDGRIMVESHYVGRLDGFRFTADHGASGVHGKAARSAAVKILATELASRAEKLCGASDASLTLDRAGRILWNRQEIAELEAGDDQLKPSITLLCDEHLQPNDKLRVLQKLNEWLARYIDIRLKPLIELSSAEDVTGLARGVAFRLKENFGVLRRDSVAEEIRALDQDARAQLRKYGVRFGAHNIYFPLLLKPAPSDLLLLLWALKSARENGLDPRALPEGPRQGLTSTLVNPAIPDALYRVIGFQVCGRRAVRIDMLERLADLIRPLIAWKPSDAEQTPPPGAAGRGGFKVTPEMMSIIGCSAEELGGVLASLGFQRETRPAPARPAGSPQQAAVQTATDIADAAAPHGAAADALADADQAEAAPADPPPPAAADAQAEQAGGEQASLDPSTPPAKPEPELEEIWRVKRARPDRAGADQRRRPQHRRRADAAAPATAATAGEAPAAQGDERRQSVEAGDKPAFQPRRERHGERRAERQGGRDQRARPAASGEAQPGQDKRAHERGDGRHGPRHFKPRQEQRGERRESQPRIVTAKPQGTPAAADSPFAALLQLKERMERQGTESG